MLNFEHGTSQIQSKRAAHMTMTVGGTPRTLARRAAGTFQNIGHGASR